MIHVVDGDCLDENEDEIQGSMSCPYSSASGMNFLNEQTVLGACVGGKSAIGPVRHWGAQGSHHNYPGIHRPADTLLEDS